MSSERSWSAFPLGPFGDAGVLCIGPAIARIDLPPIRDSFRTDAWGARQGGFAAEMAQEIAARLARGANVCELPVLWPAKPVFYVRVWRACYAIPVGETRTYGQLAAALGNPNGTRPVGQAMAKNHIPLVVPCHRVLAANGLGNFGGGVEMKRWLLACEHAVTSD